MLIKLEKIISCSSEHPSYPASNLLQQRANSSWRCAKPGELMSTVIIQLAEPSRITGLDIGNYRCCIVVVTASTSAEPDKWVPVVNHRFMTHDEAANGQFKDQVELFTKKELSAETLKTKFDRVKVCCMQSANTRELFGLAFLVLRTEVVLELGSDVLGRFKLKEETNVDDFKEKCLKLLTNKQPQPRYKDNLADKIKEERAKTFAKKQEEGGERPKRLSLSKTGSDAGTSSRVDDEDDAAKNSSACVEANKDESSSAKTSGKPVRRTPFGDVITPDANKAKGANGERKAGVLFKKRSLYYDDSSEDEEKARARKKNCPDCGKQSQDKICDNCDKLPPQKPENSPPRVKKPRRKKPKKAKKQFSQLFEDVTFSLSGYVNPQRDDIRRKALKMGGRYIVNPNTTNMKCTHLICAFKNTPKSQQLKGHTKIVSHQFIEQCFDRKKRFPWRRFALDQNDLAQSESEEEIEGTTSPVRPPNPYTEDTDSDSGSEKK